MKKLAILCLALASSNAISETIQWSGDFTSACTFSAVTPGTLIVDATSYSTDTIASYSVDNNDPGAYTVIFPAITAFAVAPSGASMSANASQGITPGGANTDPASGDDASGYSLSLTNGGSTTVNHTVSGGITSGIAGTYTIDSVVTCTAV